MHLSVYPPICLSVYVTIYVSVYLSVCLAIHQRVASADHPTNPAHPVHPAASAVIKVALDRHLPLEELPPSAFESTVGGGVKCVTAEGVVLIGNRYCRGHN